MYLLSLYSYTSVSGESFYHVLETVESSLIEPEDEAVRNTVDYHGMSDSSCLHGLYPYNILAVDYNCYYV